MRHSKACRIKSTEMDSATELRHGCKRTFGTRASHSIAPQPSQEQTWSRTAPQPIMKQKRQFSIVTQLPSPHLC
jgi:hypothetical protein